MSESKTNNSEAGKTSEFSRVRGRKRHGSRYKARRRAAEVLYEAEVRDVDPVAIIEDRIALSYHQDLGVAPVAAYTKEIVAGTAQELDRIDGLIAANLAENWELERISAVDRAVLRVAVWELIFNEDVPVATAVVDGVELVSQYSTDVAPAYVNALLDSIAQNIESHRAEPVEESPEESSEQQDSLDEQPETVAENTLTEVTDEDRSALE
ncbi:transcription antitermination factor NusB [Corynebacterium pseudotuberculosis]|uniref:transcription antitermination factor NusB n=1 Tax=Corynebacterium pseudotuberculosis TaxID=1719 RepID=UPI0010C3608F|nr:transcription antitermination factor NusB [Corynebacterium pseudotuberculosis]VTQ79877.1 N utilization substance protein B [Corynebacterium pseudotuberculosis]